MVSRAPGLSSFLDSDQFSDITLKFSGREFKSHKLILAAKSGWFRGVFESAFKEASANVIELHGDNPEALEIALRFLYGYRIPVPADEQATFEANVAWYLILYEVSNKYDIPSLADATARIVHDHFGWGNHILARDIIAHSLYHELSRDGHGFKKRYIRAMREVLPQFDEGMKQFTRDNPEFAVDIMADMWDRRSRECMQTVRCPVCGFGMTVELHALRNEETPRSYYKDILHMMNGRCLRCDSHIDPFL